MRRVMALVFPSLGIDLARRRRRRAERPEPGSAAPLDIGRQPSRGAGGGRGARPARSARWPHPGSPVLLTETVAGRVLVVERCPSAAARGVRLGLTVDEARALLAPAQPWIEEHRPDRDARALASLGQWALRFTPAVALAAPSGLVLEVAGLERLAGDEQRLARRILDAAARLGLNGRAAIADTFGAAFALARFGGRSPLVVASGAEEAALAPLPIEALRLAPSVCEGLRELSVERVEHLARLERGRVAARFGGDVLLRLDQALGRAFEPLTPLRPEEAPEAERAFEGPVQRLDVVLLAAEELVHELCAELAPAGLGASELTLDLFPSDRAAGAPPERIRLSLGRASANPRHIWNVARPRAERMQLGYGIERVRWIAWRTARLPRSQTTAFDAVEDGLQRRAIDRELSRELARDSEREARREPERDARRAIDQHFGELVDVLVGRFGAEAVRVARAVETHVPERAYESLPITLEGDPSARLRSGAARATPAPRPSLLFQPPEAVEPAPRDRLRFRWRGSTFEVLDWTGPERIARPWWESRAEIALDEVRDYYRVRTRSGHRLWMFARKGGLFVHGEWA